MDTVGNPRVKAPSGTRVLGSLTGRKSPNVGKIANVPVSPPLNEKK